MQKKWRLRQQRTLIYMMVTMVILIMLLVFLNLKAYNDSQSPITVQITSGGDERWSKVSASVRDTKFWINNMGLPNQNVGAQYDAVIENKSGSDITNWKFIIAMPAKGHIDSNWNGTLEQEGNTLIFTPDDNTCVIPAGSNKTFGFVMISESLLTFDKFEFTGFYQKQITNYGLFWLLIIAGVLWLVFFVSYIMVARQIKQYEKRRQNDTKIIAETMEMFAEMIDAKDSYTKGHSIRVAFYAKEIARRMQMEEEEVETVGYVALMHDCGKMGVPDSILTKPDNLEPNERKFIQEHTIMGGKMLENFASIDGIKEGALYHHERYDGNGYPAGLKGEEIPLYARIICVADCYDAMNTNRCYQEHRDEDVILNELKKNSGTQFDPEIVKYMIEMIEDGFCNPENVPES